MSDRDPEVVAVLREWLDKAGGDLAAARVLLDSDAPLWTVCFHAQQSVEKYLKALLVAEGTPFGKTHDIGDLTELLPPARRPRLTAEEAFALTRSAVAGRYPEAPPVTRDRAERLLRHAQDVHEFVREVLADVLRAP